MSSPGSSARGSLFPVHRSWKVALVVAIVMLLLALLGVGLTSANRAIAPTYWMSLVPVYGVLCVAAAWNRMRFGEGAHRLVLRQIFHWVGIAAALALEFFIRSSNEESGKAAGFNALLLLALGCFLAGVHLEWLFTIVGILLALLLIVVDNTDQYLWLIMAIGIVVLIGLFWLMRILARTVDQSSGPSR